jgi:hypothetical protein
MGDDLEARRAWAQERQQLRQLARTLWEGDYRAALGKQVEPPPTPSQSVVVNLPGRGQQVLFLPVADAVHPRIDAVCADQFVVRVLAGTPSACPVPPAAPYGYMVIARVRVPANSTAVQPDSVMMA